MHAIEAHRNDAPGAVNFKIVDLDANTVADLEREDAQHAGQSQTMAQLDAFGRADLIGPGDVLAINIYEVGVALFSGSNTKTIAGGFDPSAHSENFPAIMVNAKGNITIPYLGVLHVTGLTTDEVAERIEHGLRSKSQDPKALVAIRQNTANIVYVMGDVHKPGRMDLSLGRERLLDAIANAGWSNGSPEDTVVRLTRGHRSVEQRLGTIHSGSPDDLVLIPGDRIQLIMSPRVYMVFGATNHVSEVAFEKSGVTMAEAIARTGGPSDAFADPSAVLLFRYAAQAEGRESRPVVYRLNLLTADSYFLAQRVAIHDHDVIYIANAAANRPAKLMGIINTLFAPFVAAKTVAQ